MGFMNYRCETCLDSVIPNYANFNLTNYENSIEPTFFSTQELDKCGKIEIDQCQVSTFILPSPNFDSSDPEINNCCNLKQANQGYCNFDRLISRTYQNYTACESYVYYSENYQSTIISEFDLVCGNAWLASLSSSIFAVGTGIGGLIGGFLSDKYGRKYVLLSSVAIMGLSAGFSYFSTSIYMFIIFRFFMGCAANASAITRVLRGQF